jgi:hypothetical protein
VLKAYSCEVPLDGDVGNVSDVESEKICF